MHMVAFKPDRGSSDTTPPDRRRSPRRRTTPRCADIVQVTADASDNVGVAGVQFLVDGQATGAEDTNRAVRAGLGHPRRRQRRTHADREGARRGRQHRNLGARGGQRRQHRLLPERDPGHRVRPADDIRVPARRADAGRRAAGHDQVLPPALHAARRPGCSCRSPTSDRPACSRGSTTSCSIRTSPPTTIYYVFYTLGSPNRDRVSRFTANAALTGTVPGSEFVLYEDPQDADAEHHGGALNFGNDGKLLLHDR